MTENTLNDPCSSLDYYSKQDICNFIAEKTFPTFSKWEAEGKVFSPRAYKNLSAADAPSTANRPYYSLADAMRISIILYGFINMALIYKLLIHKHFKGENGIEVLMNRSSVISEIIRGDIKNALDIIKYEISNEIENPMNLKNYITQEHVNGK